MSVEAITWALRQPISHSSAKFVLVVLANCAGADSGLAFPSIAYLATATGQDRKTICANLARLQAWGLIEDSGERRGTTRQIVVYRVLSGPDLFTESGEKRNSSENGTVPKTSVKSPVFPGKSTENGTRNRQIQQEPDTHPPRALDLEGSFEGYPDPPASTALAKTSAGATPAGIAAANFRKRGYRVTSQDPNLLAALNEGVSIELLLEFADLYPPDHPKCRGSPGYVIAAARGQHQQPADSAGEPHAARERSRESAADRIRRIAVEAEERDRAADQHDAHVVDANG